MLRSNLKYASLAAAVVCCLTMTPVSPALARLQGVKLSAPSQSGDSGGAIQMPPMVPGKSELASSAFEKLDAAHLGYLTKPEAEKLPGFDEAFDHADKNKDGRLDKSEFKIAWAEYTGGTQGI